MVAPSGTRCCDRFWETICHPDLPPGRGWPLATLAHDLLQEVTAAYALEDYPLLEAVTNDLANGDDALRRRMTRQAKQCVRPAIAYFREKFSHIDSPLQRVVKLLFKALRLFCPLKVASLMQPHPKQHWRPAEPACVGSWGDNSTAKNWASNLPHRCKGSWSCWWWNTAALVEETDTSANVAVGCKSRVIDSAIFSTSRESLLAVEGAHQPPSNSDFGGSFGDGTDATIQQWPLHSMISGGSEFLCGVWSNEALFWLSFDEVSLLVHR